MTVSVEEQLTRLLSSSRGDEDETGQPRGDEGVPGGSSSPRPHLVNLDQIRAQSCLGALCSTDTIPGIEITGLPGPRLGARSSSSSLKLPPRRA